jgi:hypothetical protein
MRSWRCSAVAESSAVERLPQQIASKPDAGLLGRLARHHTLTFAHVLYTLDSGARAKPVHSA